MDFFKFGDSVDDFRFSFGFADKAKAAAKVAGIAVANTAIFAGKAAVAIGDQAIEQKKRLEEEQKRRQK